MTRYYITKKSEDGSSLIYPTAPQEPVNLQSYGKNGAGFDPIRDTVWGYVEYAEPLDEQTAAASGLIKGSIPTYYAINETAARRAKEMMSFSDYKPNSATSEYRRMVDEARVIADQCKDRTDPMYHEKIDALMEKYSYRLAENMNRDYEIGTRCPSVMIAGPANFPSRKKEKQVAAWEKNTKDFEEVQDILRRMRSVGHGGISSDDPTALQKLRAKLAGLEELQEQMKATNAYYRKNKTLDGCPHLTEEQVERLKAEMARSWHPEERPYLSFELTNNNANIRRIRARIAELEKRQAEPAPEGWEYDGGRVEMNTAENRLQLFFEAKPENTVRDELKSYGFRWSPKNGCWQRQLTDNAIRTAQKIVPPLA